MPSYVLLSDPVARAALLTVGAALSKATDSDTAIRVINSLADTLGADEKSTNDLLADLTAAVNGAA